MTTHLTNLFRAYINMHVRIDRRNIQGGIEYVDNTVNIEPGIDMDIYSGKL